MYMYQCLIACTQSRIYGWLDIKVKSRTLLDFDKYPPQILPSIYHEKEKYFGCNSHFSHSCQYQICDSVIGLCKLLLYSNLTILQYIKLYVAANFWGTLFCRFILFSFRNLRCCYKIGGNRCFQTICLIVHVGSIMVLSSKSVATS